MKAMLIHPRMPALIRQHGRRVSKPSYKALEHNRKSLITLNLLIDDPTPQSSGRGLNIHSGALSPEFFTAEKVFGAKYEQRTQ